MDPQTDNKGLTMSEAASVLALPAHLEHQLRELWDEGSALDLEPGSDTRFHADFGALLATKQLSSDELASFLRDESLDPAVTIEALKIIAEQAADAMGILGALISLSNPDLRLTCLRLIARLGGRNAVQYINQALSRERNEMIAAEGREHLRELQAKP